MSKIDSNAEALILTVTWVVIVERKLSPASAYPGTELVGKVGYTVVFPVTLGMLVLLSLQQLELPRQRQLLDDVSLREQL